MAENDTQSQNQVVASEGGNDGDQAPVDGVVNDRQARQPSAGESFMAITKSLIIRAVIIYFITSFFRRQPQTPPAAQSGQDVGPAAARMAASNVLQDGQMLDMLVYLSEDKGPFKDFQNREALAWVKEDLVYGDWTSGPESDGVYTYTHTFTPSEQLVNNGSLYLHVFFVRAGHSADPSAPDRGLLYDPHATMSQTIQLNKYKKKKYKKTTNLLTGETEMTEEEVKKAEAKQVEIVSHWHPNITINLVHDYTAWSRGSVPPPLDEYVKFSPMGDKYQPITFVNTYWNLLKDYQPLNDTVKELSLAITYQPLGLFKWQLYAAQAMKNRWPGTAMLEGLQGEEDEEDQDSLKEAFLETSPYLLGLTMAVSLLHSVFEFLAFKNDIQFWNERKSMEGLSVRSVFFNVFQSLIVLLYVLDNETNFVIKFSCFIGLGIECWKITKVMNVSINRERRIIGIPTLKFEDKGTYVESQTKVYDQMAFRYLGLALFPLLGGYSVYALLYQEHKGWYSFVLSMAYGFLLTFGFIMMTPQLFINYKLKSVAHLPWRMLTYKALNTFIDDIFAFVIKMPTMYRIGCLRDDVIFFIFLYQRYIYRVDPSRVNEFGTSLEMEKQATTTANGQPQPAIEAEAIEAKAPEAKKED